MFCLVCILFKYFLSQYRGDFKNKIWISSFSENSKRSITQGLPRTSAYPEFTVPTTSYYSCPWGWMSLCNLSLHFFFSLKSREILSCLKNFVWVFCTTAWKFPNELFGQPNVSLYLCLYPKWKFRKFTLGNSLAVWWLASFPGGSVVKNLPASVGDTGEADLIPEWGSSPGGGNGNPLQYPCPDNPIDRGGWQAAVHADERSWMRLSHWAHRGTQWLASQSSTARGTGLIPGQGTKNPHAAQSGKKKKKLPRWLYAWWNVECFVFHMLTDVWWPGSFTGLAGTLNSLINFTLLFPLWGKGNLPYLFLEFSI